MHAAWADASSWNKIIPLLQMKGIQVVAEQSLDDDFGLLIVALAENLMPDAPLRVGEIECRPIFVVERAPYRVVVIDHDRILDAHVLCSPANVVNVFLERELGRVYADHHQSVILVLVRQLQSSRPQHPGNGGG